MHSLHRHCKLQFACVELYRMALGSLELETYRREQRRRPVAEVQPVLPEPVRCNQGVSTRRQHRSGGQRTQHSYRTRAARGEQHLASEFEASLDVASSPFDLLQKSTIVCSCICVCDVVRTLITWT